MKTKILILIFIVMACTTGKNQNYIGVEYGSYDLSKINFEENIDTLFSKIPHLILPHTQNKFNPENGKYSIADTIAYEIRIEKIARSSQLFHFSKPEFTTNNVNVILTKNKDFAGFKFNEFDTEYLKDFIDFLKNRYNGFEVNYENSAFDVVTTLKWETTDLIILFNYSFEQEKNHYSMSVFKKDKIKDLPTNIIY